MKRKNLKKIPFQHLVSRVFLDSAADKEHETDSRFNFSQVIPNKLSLFENYLDTEIMYDTNSGSVFQLCPKSFALLANDPSGLRKSSLGSWS